MIVTYYRHSCFSVGVAGQHLLFDPFIRPNPLASKIDVCSLHPDYIIVSHGQWDHVAGVLEIANNSKAYVIANYEICEWYVNQGLTNVLHMNTGGKKAFEWGT